MKIRDLITQDKATLSFEVFPPKKDTDFADVEAAALGIAALKPDYMSVTYGAGGSTKGHTIQLAREIQEKYDVPTIAHLTCVCASRDGIKNALVEMKNAGIENILALRGDIPKNYDGQVFTEFSHASELVELIKESGDFCVGGSIIRNVPVPIRTIPIILTAVSFSPRKIRASIIVSTVLDLSIGVTLFTSPRRKALK